MSEARQPQAQVELYLSELREHLGGLPADEVEEILRELRGHIAERVAQRDSARNGAAIDAVLRQLGTPEQIGSLYRADALAAHARASFSPSLIIQATIRWASRTAVGFLAFLAGMVGYALGVSLIVCAILKPFFPADVGLWISRHGMVLGAELPRPHGQELLGWWIIPYGLGVGLAFILGTTVLLRWLLRFVPRAALSLLTRAPRTGV